MKKKILVVDDDDNLRIVMQETLESCGYDVGEAESGATALNVLKKKKFDLVITDLMMPGIKGIDLIERASGLYPEMGFLVISAYGTIETAVDAMRKGAFDFITKPFSIEHIESRVERFFEYQSLQQENITLKKRLLDHKLQVKLVGQSKSIHDIFYNIDVVAQTDATVFIRGESGTGKELIAEAIHDNSNRSDQPFLKINCAAVPEGLFESTLFGHEKGSFSGAYKSQKGIFEECDGGTLLLDEISEIPYNMQAKLLRVLQEMKVNRVGSTIEVPIDVRIIATSNRDLHDMILKSNFREDLFFRLNVFPITIHPLKDRKEDIPVLVDHFLKIFKRKYKYTSKIITNDALHEMMAYNWPGNVRQLEHMLERAILFSGTEEKIELSHLNFEPEMEEIQEEVDLADHVPTLAEMEKKLIFAALKKTHDHRTNAADLLGITVRTLRNKLKQYDLDRNEAE